MNRLRLFVSVPMANKSEEDIKSSFLSAYQEVNDHYSDMRDFSLILIDTYFNDDSTPLEMLGKAIALMSQADLVYFCKGWESARGCQVEHLAAQKYNKVIIHEGDFNK